MNRDWYKENWEVFANVRCLSSERDILAQTDVLGQRGMEDAHTSHCLDMVGRRGCGALIFNTAKTSSVDTTGPDMPR
jgi:hypothetical protein